MADEQSKRSIDDRLDALTMNLELLAHDNQSRKEELEALKAAGEINTKNIASLIQIAEMHERRLRNLEGSE